MHLPNESHTTKHHVNFSHADIRTFCRNLSIPIRSCLVPVRRGGFFLSPYVSHICRSFIAGHMDMDSMTLHHNDPNLDSYTSMVFVEDIVDTGDTILNIVKHLNRYYPNVNEIHVVSLVSKQKGEQKLAEMDDMMKITIRLHSMISGINDECWIHFPWEPQWESSSVK